MCVYVRTKFQVSSIILTRFRREVILPTPTPRNTNPKNPTHIKINLKTIPNRYSPCFNHNFFVHKSVSRLASRTNILTIYYKLEQVFITNWGSLIITKWGGIITKWGIYHKLGQPLLQIGAAITNWDKLYYILQIGA